MMRDTRHRPARRNAKGQAITVPLTDSVASIDRLALRRFSFQDAPPPRPTPRENRQ